MKAIVFDLDDTLLHDDLSISAYTAGILRRLHDEGFLIIPASGRAKDSMMPFVSFLGCTDFFISCNGAEIWCSQTGELLHRTAFPVSVCHEIAAYGEMKNCYTQTYDCGMFYYSVESEWAERYRQSSMLPGTYVGSLLRFIKEPRSKILMMDTPEKIAGMLVEARRLFEGKASVTCSKPYFLEFNPPDATKGKAVSFIAGANKLSLSDVICFGDSINDLSMLTACGMGVAVGNARDDVKCMCNTVCDSNNNDGVARFLADQFKLSL